MPFSSRLLLVYMLHRPLVHCCRMISVVNVYEMFCCLPEAPSVFRELLLLGLFRSSTCSSSACKTRLCFREAYRIVVCCRPPLPWFLPEAQQPQERQRRKRQDYHGKRQSSAKEPSAHQTDGRQGRRTSLLCGERECTASSIL